jgi:hypothetical protein
MTRTRILFSRRRFQLLATLTALLLAVGVVIASSASFTARSANPRNVFSTGDLVMKNRSDGMSVTVANMVPGDWHDGAVTITNTGVANGRFFLEPVTITEDTMGGEFSGQLRLTVTEVDPGETLVASIGPIILPEGTVLYTGPLSGLERVDLGVWDIDEQHKYAFNVAFPDQGRDEDGDGVDNRFMGASTTADFYWSAVSVSEDAP